MYGIREVWRLSRFGVGIVEFLIELGLMSNRRNFSLSLSLSMFAKVYNSRGNISIPSKISCSGNIDWKNGTFFLFLSLCSQEHIIREEIFLLFLFHFVSFSFLQKFLVRGTSTEKMVLSLSLSLFLSLYVVYNAEVYNSRRNISIPSKVSCSRTRKMVLFLSLCSQEHIIREETFLPFPLSFHFFFFKSSKVSCSGNIGWKNGTFFLFLSLSLYARKNI